MERAKYKIIIDRLINEPVVKPLAVINVGSLVRGNNDNLSDFDFILIWENTRHNIWPEGACRINGQKCGIRNMTYKSLLDRPWSQIERHSYSFAKTEYDPQKLMEVFIKEKCVWGVGERVDLFCELLFKISYIVNLTDNYKNCWNERDELKMAIARRQDLQALYLTTEFIHSILKLAIVTDKAFIPSHKVCFSEWVRVISPNASVIYQATMNDMDIVCKPDVERLKSFYQSYIQNLITTFESEEKLPENIMEHRNKIVRISHE